MSSDPQSAVSTADPTTSNATYAPGEYFKSKKGVMPFDQFVPTILKEVEIGLADAYQSERSLLSGFCLTGTRYDSAAQSASTKGLCTAIKPILNGTLREAKGMIQDQQSREGKSDLPLVLDFRHMRAHSTLNDSNVHVIVNFHAGPPSKESLLGTWDHNWPMTRDKDKSQAKEGTCGWKEKIWPARSS